MLTPHPYQAAGTRFLSTRPALLADKCGLGKTAQAIWAMLEIRKRLSPPNHTLMWVLVVCPKVLKEQWIKEIKKAIPYPTVQDDSIKGTPELAIIYDGSGPNQWTIIIRFAHYEQFRGRGVPQPVTQQYLETNWDLVICDEVHKIKHRDTQTAKWIKKLKTTWKLGLSASLTAERVTDLWSPLNWIAPDRFPYFWPWIEKYAETYYENGRRHAMDIAPESDKLRLLREDLAPYFMVRTMEDVGMQLPDLTTTDIPIEISRKHTLFYERVRKQVVVDLIADARNYGLVDLDALGKSALYIKCAIARYTRLRQTLSDATEFQQTFHQNKFDWLEEYVLNGGDPALIFTSFNTTRKRIEQKLKDLVAEDYIVGTWERVGTGLNLQHLHVVICWDLPLSYNSYEQGIGRVHRQGQERPTFVYRLISKLPKPYRAKTADQKVQKLIDCKAEKNEILLEWLRGIRDEEILR